MRMNSTRTKNVNIAIVLQESDVCSFTQYSDRLDCGIRSYVSRLAYTLLSLIETFPLSLSATKSYTSSPEIAVHEFGKFPDI